MRRTFHTPEGIIVRELTPEEVRELARNGDSEAIREIAREEWKTANTSTKKIAVIAKALGVID